MHTIGYIMRKKQNVKKNGICIVVETLIIQNELSNYLRREKISQRVLLGSSDTSCPDLHNLSFSGYKIQNIEYI